MIAAVAIVAYYVLFQSFYNLVSSKMLFPYESVNELILGVVLNIMPIIIITCLTWCVVFRKHKNDNIRSKMVLDGLLCILILIGYNILYKFVMEVLGYSQYAYVDWPGTGFSMVLIYLAVEVAYYVMNFKHQLSRTEEQKRLALQYQYDAMKAQVNPHFLFNSLNILYSLVSVDQRKSQEFIVMLSQMYRYILSQQNKERIRLSEELNFLNAYVAVLKMRHTDCFDVVIEGTTNIGSQEIIPYTMQLLIENVTKHNVISTRYPMTVTINIDESGITVSNPIRKKFSCTTSGIGLRYITKLYGLHHKQVMIDDNDKIFTAKIPFI